MDALSKFAVISQEQAKAMDTAICSIDDYEMAESVYNGLANWLSILHDHQMLLYLQMRRLEREGGDKKR